jgi:hypothetical protein
VLISATADPGEWKQKDDQFLGNQPHDILESGRFWNFA